MKKISAHTYAQAYVQAVSSLSGAKLEKAANRFIARVRKNGDSSRITDIARACEQLLRSRDAILSVCVESARPLQPAQFAHIEKIFSGKKAVFEKKINPSLLAGIRLTIDENLQRDISLSHLLRRVFSHTSMH